MYQSSLDVLYNYILVEIMNKFIIKKRKSDEDEISFNFNIESKSGESNQASSSSTGLGKRLKIRLYSISYLAVRFTCYGNENCSQPECIVCRVKLFSYSSK